MQLNISLSSKQDKSQKRRSTNMNKAAMWNVFDSEINAEKAAVPLECLFSREGSRESPAAPHFR